MAEIEEPWSVRPRPLLGRLNVGLSAGPMSQRRPGFAGQALTPAVRAGTSGLLSVTDDGAPSASPFRNSRSLKRALVTQEMVTQRA